MILGEEYKGYKRTKVLAGIINDRKLKIFNLFYGNVLTNDKFVYILNV
jgi:hypothetical protein